MKYLQQTPSGVKILLRVGALFMLGEALFHFSGIRLQGAKSAWPTSAVEFSYFFHALWASASLFLSTYLSLLSTDPAKYKTFIRATGALCLFHSALLIAFSLSDMTEQLPVAALHLWHPYYDLQLILEGLLLAGAGGYFLLPSRSEDKHRSADSLKP